MVIDSRTRPDNSIRRRRECESCKRRFTTHEMLIEDNVTVIKKDSTRQPFDSKKLMVGMQRACEKTSITQEQIAKIVDDVQRRARKRKSGEITSLEIGDMVSSALSKKDDVAYIRFSSVYKKFESPEEFVATVKMLKKNKK